MIDKFKTEQGFLTPYALACGYIEQTEIQNKRVTMWLDCGLYHVRNHDFDKHTRIFWGIYDKLSTARREYKKAIKDNSRGNKND